MTTPNTLRLELGSTVLDLNNVDATGFIISTVDLGFAAPRAVTTDLPGIDGVFDETAYFSSRTIQLTGAIVPAAGVGSRSAVMDTLAPFIAANARPTLVYSFDSDTPERRLDLRVGQWGNPIDHPTNATAFAVQWVCPSPFAYSAITNEVDIPFATGSPAGRVYNRTFPQTYPTGGFVGGDAIVTPMGTAASWATLRIFGPCTNQAVYWLDPTTATDLGVQVVFIGLTVADGDYIEVDTRAKTALLYADPMASRYSFVDFSNTAWGPLQPGPNLLKVRSCHSCHRCDL